MRHNSKLKLISKKIPKDSQLLRRPKKSIDKTRAATVRLASSILNDNYYKQTQAKHALFL
jgi:hypothetical protein